MASRDTFEVTLFQDRVRERRAALGLSQLALATAIGARQSWLSTMESKSTAYVRSNTLFALCVALDCSADYLLGLSDTPERRPQVTVVVKPGRALDPDEAAPPPPVPDDVAKALRGIYATGTILQVSSALLANYLSPDLLADLMDPHVDDAPRLEADPVPPPRHGRRKGPA